MTLWWLLLAGGLVLVVALALGMRSLHLFGREIQVGRARELFLLRREQLEPLFLAEAASTGKPRGLRWVRCDFDPELELARDRQTGQLLALVPVTIRFEAIEGGDMEGVEAVGNLRHASAVFYFERGQWCTVGKAVFNLNPREALDHFHHQYERIDS